jgi:cytochrome c-type biogenesis protein CcmH/NrfG
MAVRRMTRRRTSRMRRRRRRRRIVLVGGMIAVGAYALTKSQTEQVEEYTGKQAEELTDEQLEQAMDQLGIEAEEMTDEQWAQADAADDEPEDYLDELERLSELNKQGVITDEEFEAKKKELLNL